LHAKDLKGKSTFIENNLIIAEMVKVLWYQYNTRNFTPGNSNCQQVVGRIE
jgi:hypothetical protein